MIRVSEWGLQNLTFQPKADLSSLGLTNPVAVSHSVSEERSEIYIVGSYEDLTETLVSVFVFNIAGGHKKTIPLDNSYLCGTIIANIQTGEAPYVDTLVFDEANSVGVVKVIDEEQGEVVNPALAWSRRH